MSSLIHRCNTCLKTRPIAASETVDRYGKIVRLRYCTACCPARLHAPESQPVAETPQPEKPQKQKRSRKSASSKPDTAEAEGWITSVETAQTLILQVLGSMPLMRYEVGAFIEHYTQENSTPQRVAKQALTAALDDLVECGAIACYRIGRSRRYARVFSSEVKNA